MVFTNDKHSLNQYQDLQPEKDDISRFISVAKYCCGRTLDVGCGVGALKNYLSKDLSNEYTSLDTDGYVDVRGSAYNLPFKSNSFDTVTILEVLEHLERPIDALGEVARVSNKRVIISIPNPWNINQIASLIAHNSNIYEPNHVNLFGDNEIACLCNRVGLKVQRKECTYIRLPFFQKLIPVKSRFGQWNIYVCKKERINYF